MSGSNPYAWNFVPPLGPVGPLGGQPQPPTSGTWAGMSLGQLAAARTAFQNALIALIQGQNSVTVTYNVGEGQRSVTYQRTSEVSLRGAIAELNGLLGAGCRNAIGVAFR